MHIPRKSGRDKRGRRRNRVSGFPDRGWGVAFFGAYLRQDVVWAKRLLAVDELPDGELSELLREVMRREVIVLGCGVRGGIVRRRRRHREERAVSTVGTCAVRRKVCWLSEVAGGQHVDERLEAVHLPVREMVSFSSPAPPVLGNSPEPQDSEFI